MKTDDLTLLAYVRTCAAKYPHMTIGRVMELSDTLAKEIVSGKLEIEERRVPLGDRRFKENKPCATKTDELTEKQAECLRIIIELQTNQVPTTRKEIAARMGCSPTNIKFLAENLIGAGYAEEKKNPNSSGKRQTFYYRAKKSENGQPLKTKAEEAIKIGHITKCPPAYASGYGFDAPEIAGVKL
jgi:predicted transcriptional regulator